MLEDESDALKKNQRLPRFLDALIVLSWFGWAGLSAYDAESGLGRILWLALMLGAPLALFLLWRHLQPPGPWPMDAWYYIRFDDQAIELETVPPARRVGKRTIPWASVHAARFMARDVFASDEVWLFARGAKRPFAKVPTEAAGGPAFVGEVTKRGLLAVEEVAKEAEKF